MPFEPDFGDGCVRCGTGLTRHGTHEFRTGGTVGAAKLVLGQLGELGEDKIPLEVLSCRDCRRVELRLPQGR